MDKLNREFYCRDTVTVARELLGKRLVHVLGGQRLVVEITETEAYTGVNDKACHSYGGRRTPRTEILYGPPGHAYLYLIYGMYTLLNLVTEEEGNPCAVLIRGAKLLEGHDTVTGLRFAKGYDALAPAQRRGLLGGPGKLCSGLDLSRNHNGLDLCGDTLYLTEGDAPSYITVGPRIGIDYAEEDAALPYRFFVEERRP